MSFKEVRETVGLLMVVASLCFVGWEVRQNTIAARAASYQAMGADNQAYWKEAASDSIFAPLLLRSLEDPAAEFSPVEEDMLVAYWIGIFRHYEATWRQVELGLLPPEAMDMFGWSSRPAGGTHLLRWWPRIRALTSPDFADYVESSMMASS